MMASENSGDSKLAAPLTEVPQAERDAVSWIGATKQRRATARELTCSSSFSSPLLSFLLPPPSPPRRKFAQWTKKETKKNVQLREENRRKDRQIDDQRRQIDDLRRQIDLRRQTDDQLRQVDDLRRELLGATLQQGIESYEFEKSFPGLSRLAALGDQIQEGQICVFDVNKHGESPNSSLLALAAAKVVKEGFNSSEVLAVITGRVYKLDKLKTTSEQIPVDTEGCKVVTLDNAETLCRVVEAGTGDSGIAKQLRLVCKLRRTDRTGFDNLVRIAECLLRSVSPSQLFSEQSRQTAPATQFHPFLSAEGQRRRQPVVHPHQQVHRTQQLHGHRQDRGRRDDRGCVRSVFVRDQGRGCQGQGQEAAGAQGPGRNSRGF